MDMLLWQNSLQAAQRQLALLTSPRRPVFEARLALRLNAPDASRSRRRRRVARGDRSGLSRRSGDLVPQQQCQPAARGACSRAARPFPCRPAMPRNGIEVLLANARGAAADGQYSTAFDIARQVDDAYPVGTDISARPLGERDDYTSLTWLAGQTALKQLGRPAEAIGMFVRYAGGSKTATTQSKGLYWAGRAAEAAGRREEADGYYARAAGFRDLYYGQLAAERLGQPLVAPGEPVLRPVDPAIRAGFYQRETVRAAQYLGTAGAWEDQTAFVRQIAIDAKTDSDHVLASELSRSLGRPDLGVMVGRSALQNGLSDYSTLGFPSVRDTRRAARIIGRSSTRSRARKASSIARAVSHAGARGLMQLMPGTARDTATQAGPVL